MLKVLEIFCKFLQFWSILTCFFLQNQTLFFFFCCKIWYFTILQSWLVESNVNSFNVYFSLWFFLFWYRKYLKSMQMVVGGEVDGGFWFLFSFFYFQMKSKQNGTWQSLFLIYLKKNGTFGTQWQSLINSLDCLKVCK